jgi:Uncharacterized protein conserved in bacteria (DUF2059)
MTSIKHILPALLSRQLIMSAVLVFGFPTFALSLSDEQALGELIELSGLKQQIPHLPNEYMSIVDQLLAGLEQKRHAVPKSVRGAIRQSFVEALTPEYLESEIRSRLLGGLSEDTTAATVNWLRSDVGKKITAAELNLRAADTPVQLATFLIEFQLERPAPERLQLARRIEEINQGSEMATEAWEVVSTAVARALDCECGTNNLQKLEESLAFMRGSMKGMFHQGRIFEVLFTYRTLTDEELKQYAEFLETPAGKDVTQIMNRAVQGAAIDAIQKIQANPRKNWPAIKA